MALAENKQVYEIELKVTGLKEALEGVGALKKDLAGFKDTPVKVSIDDSTGGSIRGLGNQRNTLASARTPPQVVPQDSINTATLPNTKRAMERVDAALADSISKTVPRPGKSSYDRGIARYSASQVDATASSLENLSKEAIESTDNLLKMLGTKVGDYLQEVRALTRGVALEPPLSLPSYYRNLTTLQNTPTSGRQPAFVPITERSVSRVPDIDTNSIQRAVRERERIIADALKRIEDDFTDAFKHELVRSSGSEIKVLSQDIGKKLRENFRLLSTSVDDIAEQYNNGVRDFTKTFERGKLIQVKDPFGDFGGLQLQLLNLKKFAKVYAETIQHGSFNIDEAGPGSISQALGEMKKKLGTKFNTTIGQAIDSFSVPSLAATKEGMRIVHSGQKGTIVGGTIDYVTIHDGLKRLAQAIYNLPAEKRGAYLGNATNPDFIRGKILEGKVSQDEFKGLLKRISAGEAGKDVSERDIVRAIQNAITYKAGEAEASNIYARRLAREGYSKDDIRKLSSGGVQVTDLRNRHDISELERSISRIQTAVGKFRDVDTLLGQADKFGVTGIDIAHQLTTVIEKSVVEKVHEALFSATKGKAPGGVTPTVVGRALVSLAGRGVEASDSGRAQSAFSKPINEIFSDVEPLPTEYRISSTGRRKKISPNVQPKVQIELDTPNRDDYGDFNPTDIYRKGIAHARATAGYLQQIQRFIKFGGLANFKPLEDVSGLALSEELAADFKYDDLGRRLTIKRNRGDNRFRVLGQSLATDRRADQPFSGTGPEFPVLRSFDEQERISRGALQPTGYNVVVERRDSPSTFEDQLLISKKSRLYKQTTGLVRQLVGDLKGQFYDPEKQSYTDLEGAKKLTYKYGQAITKQFGLTDLSGDALGSTTRVLDAAVTGIRQGGQVDEALVLKILNEFGPQAGKKLITGGTSKGVAAPVDSVFHAVEDLGQAELPASVGTILARLARGNLINPGTLNPKGASKPGSTEAFREVLRTARGLGNALFLPDETLIRGDFGLVTKNGVEEAAGPNDTPGPLLKRVADARKAISELLGKEIKNLEDFRSTAAELARNSDILIQKRDIDIREGLGGSIRRGVREDIGTAIVSNFVGATRPVVVGNQNPAFWEKIIREHGAAAGYLSQTSGVPFLSKLTERPGVFEDTTDPERKGFVSITNFGEVTKSRPQIGIHENQTLRVDPNSRAALNTAFGRDSAILRDINKIGASASIQLGDMIRVLPAIDPAFRKFNSNAREFIETVNKGTPTVSLSSLKATSGESFVHPHELEGTIFDPNKNKGIFKVPVPANLRKYRDDIPEEIYLPSYLSRQGFKSPTGAIGLSPVGLSASRLINTLKESSTPVQGPISAIQQGVTYLVNELQNRIHSTDVGENPEALKGINDVIVGLAKELFGETTDRGKKLVSAFASNAKNPFEEGGPVNALRAKQYVSSQLFKLRDVFYNDGIRSDSQGTMEENLPVTLGFVPKDPDGNSRNVLKYLAKHSEGGDNSATDRVRDILKGGATKLGIEGLGFAEGDSLDPRYADLVARQLQFYADKMIEQTAGKRNLYSSAVETELPNLRLVGTNRPVDISPQLRKFNALGDDDRLAVKNLTSLDTPFEEFYGGLQDVVKSNKENISSQTIETISIHKSQLERLLKELVEAGNIDKPRAAELLKQAATPEGIGGILGRFPVTDFKSFQARRIRTHESDDYRDAVVVSGNLNQESRELLRSNQLYRPAEKVLDEKGNLVERPETGRLAEARRELEARYKVLSAKPVSSLTAEEEKQKNQISIRMTALNKAITALTSTYHSVTQAADFDGDRFHIAVLGSTEAQEEFKRIIERMSLGVRKNAEGEYVPDITTASELQDIHTASGGSKLRKQAKAAETPDIFKYIEDEFKESALSAFFKEFYPKKKGFGLFTDVRGPEARLDLASKFQEYLKSQDEGSLRAKLKTYGVTPSLTPTGELAKGGDALQTFTREALEQISTKQAAYKLATPKILIGSVTEAITIFSRGLEADLNLIMQDIVTKAATGIKRSTPEYSALIAESAKYSEIYQHQRGGIIQAALSTKFARHPASLELLNALNASRDAKDKSEVDQISYEDFLQKITDSRKEGEESEFYNELNAPFEAASKLKGVYQGLSTDELKRRTVSHSLIEEKLGRSLFVPTTGKTYKSSKDLQADIGNLSTDDMIGFILHRFNLVDSLDLMRKNLEDYTIKYATAQYGGEESRGRQKNRNPADVRNEVLFGDNGIAKKFGFIKDRQPDVKGMVEALARPNSLGPSVNITDPNVPLSSIIEAVVRIKGPRVFDARNTLRYFGTKDLGKLRGLFGSEERGGVVANFLSGMSSALTGDTSDEESLSLLQHVNDTFRISADLPDTLKYLTTRNDSLQKYRKEKVALTYSGPGKTFKVGRYKNVAKSLDSDIDRLYRRVLNDDPGRDGISTFSDPTRDAHRKLIEQVTKSEYIPSHEREGILDKFKGVDPVSGNIPFSELVKDLSQDSGATQRLQELKEAIENDPNRIVAEASQKAKASSERIKKLLDDKRAINARIRATKAGPDKAGLVSEREGITASIEAEKAVLTEHQAQVRDIQAKVRAKKLSTIEEHVGDISQLTVAYDLFKSGKYPAPGSGPILTSSGQNIIPPGGVGDVGGYGSGTPGAPNDGIFILLKQLNDTQQANLKLLERLVSLVDSVINMISRKSLASIGGIREEGAIGPLGPETQGYLKNFGIVPSEGDISGIESFRKSLVDVGSPRIDYTPSMLASIQHDEEHNIPITLSHFANSQGRLFNYNGPQFPDVLRPYLKDGGSNSTLLGSAVEAGYSHYHQRKGPGDTLTPAELAKIREEAFDAMQQKFEKQPNRDVTQTDEVGKRILAEYLDSEKAGRHVVALQPSFYASGRDLTPGRDYGFDIHAIADTLFEQDVHGKRTAVLRDQKVSKTLEKYEAGVFGSNPDEPYYRQAGLQAILLEHYAKKKLLNPKTNKLHEGADLEKALNDIIKDFSKGEGKVIDPASLKSLMTGIATGEIPIEFGLDPYNGSQVSQYLTPEVKEAILSAIEKKDVKYKDIASRRIKSVLEGNLPAIGLRKAEFNSRNRADRPIGDESYLFGLGINQETIDEARKTGSPVLSDVHARSLLEVGLGTGTHGEKVKGTRARLQRIVEALGLDVQYSPTSYFADLPEGVRGLADESGLKFNRNKFPAVQAALEEGPLGLKNLIEISRGANEGEFLPTLIHEISHKALRGSFPTGGYGDGGTYGTRLLKHVFDKPEEYGTLVQKHLHRSALDVLSSGAADSSLSDIQGEGTPEEVSGKVKEAISGFTQGNLHLSSDALTHVQRVARDIITRAFEELLANISEATIGATSGVGVTSTAQRLNKRLDQADRERLLRLARAGIAQSFPDLKGVGRYSSEQGDGDDDDIQDGLIYGARDDFDDTYERRTGSKPPDTGDPRIRPPIYVTEEEASNMTEAQKQKAQFIRSYEAMHFPAPTNIREVASRYLAPLSDAIDEAEVNAFGPEGKLAKGKLFTGNPAQDASQESSAYKYLTGGMFKYIPEQTASSTLGELRAFSSRLGEIQSGNYGIRSNDIRDLRAQAKSLFDSTAGAVKSATGKQIDVNPTPFYSEINIAIFKAIQQRIRKMVDEFIEFEAKNSGSPKLVAEKGDELFKEFLSLKETFETGVVGQLKNKSAAGSGSFPFRRDFDFNSSGYLHSFYAIPGMSSIMERAQRENLDKVPWFNDELIKRGGLIGAGLHPDSFEGSERPFKGGVSDRLKGMTDALLDPSLGPNIDRAAFEMAKVMDIIAHTGTKFATAFDEHEYSLVRGSFNKLVDAFGKASVSSFIPTKEDKDKVIAAIKAQAEREAHKFTLSATDRTPLTPEQYLSRAFYGKGNEHLPVNLEKIFSNVGDVISTEGLSGLPANIQERAAIESQARKVARTAFTAVHGPSVRDRYSIDEPDPGDIVKLRTSIRNSAGKESVVKTLKIRGTSAENPLGFFEDERLSGGAIESRQTLSNAFKRVALWGTASGVVYGIIRAMQDMANVIKQTEVNMIELQKVMNPASTNFNQLRDSAVAFAKEFGTSVNAVLDSFVVFAKQGLGQSEVLERGRASVLAGNVTEGVKPERATEIFTSALKQFPQEGNDAIRILDSLNEVANRFAVTENDLGDSLLRAGASAKVAGVTFDEFLGLTTALAEVTRKSGREVGTSLNFMLRSIYRPKSKQALAEIGIPITDAKGLRSATDILKELSTKFDSLTSEQKLNVVEAAVGSRRYNDFAVILQNFNTAMTATAISANSQGSALRENQLVMESFAKKTQVLRASMDELAIQFGDAVLPAIKVVTDGLTGLVQLFNEVPNSVKLTTAALSTLLVIVGKQQELKYMFGDLLGAAAPGKLGSSFKTALFDGASRAVTVLSSNTKLLTFSLAGLALVFTDIGSSAKKAFTDASERLLNFLGIVPTGAEFEKKIQNSVFGQEDILQRTSITSSKFSNSGQQLTKAYRLEQENVPDILSKINEGVFESPLAIRKNALIEQQSVVNEIAKTNLDLVLTYDSQGNALLRQNDLLGVQLELVKSIAETSIALSKIQIAEAFGRDLGNLASTIESLKISTKEFLSNFGGIGNYIAGLSPLKSKPVNEIQNVSGKLGNLFARRNAGDTSVDGEITKLQGQLFQAQTALDTTISRFYENIQPASKSLKPQELLGALSSEDNKNALREISRRELAREGALNTNPLRQNELIDSRTQDNLASIVFSRFGIPIRGASSGEEIAQKYEASGLAPKGILGGTAGVNENDVAVFSDAIAKRLGFASKFAVFSGGEFKGLGTNNAIRGVSAASLNQAFSDVADGTKEKFLAVFSNVAQETETLFEDAVKVARRIPTGAGFGISFQPDLHLGARLEKELDPQLRLYRKFGRELIPDVGSRPINFLDLVQQQQRALELRKESFGLTKEDKKGETPPGSEETDALARISQKNIADLQELQKTLANNAAILTFATEIQNLEDTISAAADSIRERREIFKFKEVDEANLLAGGRGRQTPDLGTRIANLNPFERQIQGNTAVGSLVDVFTESKDLQNDFSNIGKSAARSKLLVQNIIRDFGNAGIGVNKELSDKIVNAAQQGPQALAGLQGNEYAKAQVDVSKQIYSESALTNRILEQLLPKSATDNLTSEVKSKLGGLSPSLDRAISLGDFDAIKSIKDEIYSLPGLASGEKSLIGDDINKRLNDNKKGLSLAYGLPADKFEEIFSKKLQEINSNSNSSSTTTDPLKYTKNLQEFQDQTLATMDQVESYALAQAEQLKNRREILAAHLDAIKAVTNEVLGTIESGFTSIIHTFSETITSLSAPSVGIGELAGFKPVSSSVDLRSRKEDLSPEERLAFSRGGDIVSLNLLNSSFQQSGVVITNLQDKLAQFVKEGQSSDVQDILRNQIDALQSAREDIAEQIKDLAESLSKGLATEKLISSLENVRKEVDLFSIDKNNDYNKSSIQNAQDVQARQVLTDKRGNKYFGQAGLSPLEQEFEKNNQGRSPSIREERNFDVDKKAREEARKVQEAKDDLNREVSLAQDARKTALEGVRLGVPGSQRILDSLNSGLSDAGNITGFEDNIPKFKGVGLDTTLKTGIDDLTRRVEQGKADITAEAIASKVGGKFGEIFSGFEASQQGLFEHLESTLTVSQSATDNLIKQTNTTLDNILAALRGGTTGNNSGIGGASTGTGGVFGIGAPTRGSGSLSTSGVPGIPGTSGTAGTSKAVGIIYPGPFFRKIQVNPGSPSTGAQTGSQAATSSGATYAQNPFSPTRKSLIPNLNLAYPGDIPLGNVVGGAALALSSATLRAPRLASTPGSRLNKWFGNNRPLSVSPGSASTEADVLSLMKTVEEASGYRATRGRVLSYDYKGNPPPPIPIEEASPIPVKNSGAISSSGKVVGGTEASSAVSSEQRIATILERLSAEKPGFFRRAGSSLLGLPRKIKQGILSVNDFNPEGIPGRFLSKIPGALNKALLPVGIAAGGFDVYNQYRQGQAEGDTGLALGYDALMGKRDQVSGKGAYTGTKNALGNILGTGGRFSALGALPGIALGAGAILGVPFTGGTSLSLLPAAGAAVAGGASAGFLAGTAAGTVREGVNAFAVDEVNTGDKLKDVLQKAVDPATAYFVSVARRLREVDAEIAGIDLSKSEGGVLSTESLNRRNSLSEEKGYLSNIAGQYSDFKTGSGDKNKLISIISSNNSSLSLGGFNTGIDYPGFGKIGSAFDKNKAKTASLASASVEDINGLVALFTKNIGSIATKKAGKGSNFQSFTQVDIESAFNEAAKNYNFSNEDTKSDSIRRASELVYSKNDKFLPGGEYGKSIFDKVNNGNGPYSIYDATSSVYQSLVAPASKSKDAKIESDRNTDTVESVTTATDSLEELRNSLNEFTKNIDTFNRNLRAVPITSDLANNISTLNSVLEQSSAEKPDLTTATGLTGAMLSGKDVANVPVKDQLSAIETVQKAYNSVSVANNQGDNINGQYGDVLGELMSRDGVNLDSYMKNIQVNTPATPQQADKFPETFANSLKEELTQAGLSTESLKDFSTSTPFQNILGAINQIPSSEASKGISGQDILLQHIGNIKAGGLDPTNAIDTVLSSLDKYSSPIIKDNSIVSRPTLLTTPSPAATVRNPYEFEGLKSFSRQGDNLYTGGSSNAEVVANALAPTLSPDAALQHYLKSTPTADVGGTLSPFTSSSISVEDRFNLGEIYNNAVPKVGQKLNKVISGDSTSLVPVDPFGMKSALASSQAASLALRPDVTALGSALTTSGKSIFRSSELGGTTGSNLLKNGVLASFAAGTTGPKEKDDYTKNIELTKALGLQSVYEKEGISFKFKGGKEKAFYGNTDKEVSSEDFGKNLYKKLEDSGSLFSTQVALGGDKKKGEGKGEQGKEGKTDGQGSKTSASELTVSKITVTGSIFTPLLTATKTDLNVKGNEAGRQGGTAGAASETDVIISTVVPEVYKRLVDRYGNLDEKITKLENGKGPRDVEQDSKIMEHTGRLNALDNSINSLGKRIDTVSSIADCAITRCPPTN